MSFVGLDLTLSDKWHWKQQQQLFLIGDPLQSLLTFNKIITNLSLQKRMIPYRESKLTSILKETLGGNCITVLIVCVANIYGKTERLVEPIRISSTARRIVNKPTINALNSEEQRRYIEREGAFAVLHLILHPTAYLWERLLSPALWSEICWRSVKNVDRSNSITGSSKYSAAPTNSYMKTIVFSSLRSLRFHNNNTINLQTVPRRPDVQPNKSGDSTSQNKNSKRKNKHACKLD
ncbi:hypothetical protein TNCV_2964561 [Trichonephila clavipes]|nr:hypothetical protein TNCV_2964561 [Trichonephila clavipes]